MKNNDSLGFKIFAVSAFLVVGMVAVVLAFNPLERMKLDRDERLKRNAKSLVSAIQSFYNSKGRLPWVLGLTADSSTPPLKWISYSAPEVGVCADSICQNPGELIQSGKLSSDFLLTGARTLKNPDDSLLVGRGKRAGDRVYACFVPQSEENRKATGRLYKLKAGLAMPPSGQPAECGDNVNWEEEDVCYVCVQ